VDDTPAGNTVVDDTPAGNTVVDDTPAGNTVVDDTPAGNTVVDDTPAGTTAAGNTVADDTAAEAAAENDCGVRGRPPCGDPPGEFEHILHETLPETVADVSLPKAEPNPIAHAHTPPPAQTDDTAGNTVVDDTKGSAVVDDTAGNTVVDDTKGSAVVDDTAGNTAADKTSAEADALQAAEAVTFDPAETADADDLPFLSEDYTKSTQGVVGKQVDGKNSAGAELNTPDADAQNVPPVTEPKQGGPEYHPMQQGQAPSMEECEELADKQCEPTPGKSFCEALDDMEKCLKSQSPQCADILLQDPQLRADCAKEGGASHALSKVECEELAEERCNPPPLKGSPTVTEAQQLAHLCDNADAMEGCVQNLPQECIDFLGSDLHTDLQKLREDCAHQDHGQGAGAPSDGSVHDDVRELEENVRNLRQEVDLLNRKIAADKVALEHDREAYAKASAEREQWQRAYAATKHAAETVEARSHPGQNLPQARSHAGQNLPEVTSLDASTEADHSAAEVDLDFD